MLGHATGQVNMNDRIGDGLEAFDAGHLNGRLQLEQLWKSQSKTGERSKLEEVTTALTRGEVRVVALAEGVHFHVGKLLDSINLRFR